jgi:hypothetical protein
MEIDMNDRQFVKKCAEAMSNARDAKSAAVAVHKVCFDYAKMVGMTPSIEVAIRHKADGHWYVGFEAGPYEWAVSATLSNGGPVLAEPYYSFDIDFYDMPN